MESGTFLLVVLILTSISIIIQVTMGVMNADHNSNLVGLNREKNEKKVVFINPFIATISVLCFVQYDFPVTVFVLAIIYVCAFYIQLTMK